MNAIRIPVQSDALMRARASFTARSPCGSRESAGAAGDSGSRGARGADRRTSCVLEKYRRVFPRSSERLFRGQVASFRGCYSAERSRAARHHHGFGIAPERRRRSDLPGDAEVCGAEESPLRHGGDTRAHGRPRSGDRSRVRRMRRISGRSGAGFRPGRVHSYGL
jgi:hypothetical protein